MPTTDMTTKLAEALRHLVNVFPVPVDGVKQADRESLRISLFYAREALRLYDAAKAQPVQDLRKTILKVTESYRGTEHGKVAECIGDALIEALAATPAPANPDWCKGCTPENCGGCATPAPEPLTTCAGLYWSHNIPMEIVSWLSAHPPSVRLREPLTDEHIARIYEVPELAGTCFDDGTKKAIAVARAIERAHGIGKEASNG